MEIDVNASEDLTIIEEVFPFLTSNFDNLEIKEHVSEGTITKCFEIINQLNVYEFVENAVISSIETHLQNATVPKFWAHFGEVENVYEGFKNFHNAITLLHQSYHQLLEYCRRLDMYRVTYNYRKTIYNETSSSNALKVILRASVLSQLPIEYKTTIEFFYKVVLCFEESSNECVYCKKPSPECQCFFQFDNVNKILIELQMLEPLVEQVVTNLIFKQIESHIIKTCQDNYDSSHVESLEKWLEVSILSWLKKMYMSDEAAGTKQLTKLNQKLTAFIYSSYTKIRINQIFNIIIEYPDSLPALEDLKVCLLKTNLKPVLSKKLQKAMETRLLHPGVSTPDILTAYVAAIRSMRVLDPSGLLLDTVTQPVHQYLRSREDTVRCVVSSLTEEGPNDLAEELVKGEVLQTEENLPSDEENENWESWMPDPIDADPNKAMHYRRTSDIISMLVNVYGSKELFVNEYRTLLADRLLSQFSCDTEKEIRYLELLKLRFGDSQLHYCEVMLKDIADSKRINQHIKQDPNYNDQRIPLSAMILSAQFWPPFKEDKLEIYISVEMQMEDYTKEFEALKGNRTLNWKYHIGIVDLEIELPNRTLNLTVSPMHATIILNFQHRHKWELEALSRMMNVPGTFLKRKLAFWQSHGLIEEISPDSYQLCEEDADNGNAAHEDVVLDEYEAESAMASAEDQREEELQTFWSYIIGMLMNLDSLPLERIHQMLKMFAFQGPTIECTMQELKKFLDRKVREHELVFSGGLYRLPKQ